MKTLILKIPLLLMMIWAGLAHAQITTTAGTLTSCPGDTAVPILVTNCNGIGSVSLVLNYDTAKLTYLGYKNLHPALSTGLLVINATGTRVVISWANTVAANLGNSTMVELRFNTIPSVTNLTWDTQTSGNCEYTDINGNILPSIFTNGTLTINQPPLINTQPVDKTALVGQNTSFSVSAIGTGMDYLWQISTNGGGIWTDLVNNATYSGVTTATLGIANVQLTHSGYKYRCRLTGTCPPVINTNVVTLTVINPITTTLPTASFCPGNIVVPVTVTNFTGVAAFSLTFSYNRSCLTYTGYQNLNVALSQSGSLFVADTSAGKVYMTWSFMPSASFGNGTIVELKFAAATGTSPLVWDLGTEGNCEYSAPSGLPITSVFVNGNETIYALPSVTVQPVNKTIAKGQSTSFSITASGSGLNYLWQEKLNGGVNWTDLTNTGVFTNVTTATMNITGAPLSMSGNQYRCRVTGTCAPVVYSDPALLLVLPNVITNCGSATACPGQVVIPVTVTDFIGVASFSLALNFNPAILTFTGYQSLNAALTAVPGYIFTANATGGVVYLTWSHTTAATVANGATLVELKFNGVTGASALTWNTGTPGNCEYSDLSGQVIFSTWNNGNATVNQPPSINTSPVNATIYAGGSTTFSVAASGTGLAFLWQLSTNGGTIWNNLSNGSPYSGVNTATLTINPAATGMNNNRYRCIVSGTCPPSDTSATAQLTVTQAAITTTPGAVTNSCTGNLSIPVSVTNCTNVGSISLTLIFDTIKMTFEGYHSLNAALSTGLLVVNRSGNKVMMTWASTTAANIGAGVLLQYRFRANAGISTTLTWDTPTTGACEYSDPAGTVITSFYNTSNLSVVANALIANAGPDMIKTGPSVQLNGLATGGATPYTWLWAPSGSLNNPNISNPVASPTVTTTYTMTVTGSNSCVAVDVMDVLVGVIPDDLVLQGINIMNGVSNCYNALHTITVAGGATTFEVQSGGSAIMIAGQKINYLPGTKVYSGGYLHGYITINEQYCNPADAPRIVTTTEETLPALSDGSFFRIYPNPTTGQCTLELTDENLSGSVYMTLYGSCGEIILSADITGKSNQGISLAGKPSGLYFVRVVNGNTGFTKKLVKQ